MLELKKLSGEETGVSDEFKADWEAERIDFYEDVAYGMGGEHPMYLDLMIPQEKTEKKRPVIIWVHGGGWSIPELTKKIPSCERPGTGMPHGLCLRQH